MMKKMNISDDGLAESRLLITGFAVILLLAVPVCAQDDDGAIFNRLYREIMSSAPAELTGSLDSVRPVISDAAPESSSTGESSRPISPSEMSSAPSTEQLKKKIEKMTQEATVRHSEAVKFMQNSK